MGSRCQPSCGPVTEAGRRELRIDPLGTLLLRLDVDEEPLGVDLAPKRLGSFPASGVDVTDLPP